MSSCGQYKWFGVGHCTSESCSIVAFLNHGKYSKGTSSSSASSNSQNPCVDTCVTSAAKVIVPGIFNFLTVRFYHCLGITELTPRKTGVIDECDSWGKPEFRFAVRVGNMNMDARFLAGKEKQTELTIANNRGSHLRILPVRN